MRGIVALMRVLAASLVAAGGLALGCGEFGSRFVDLAPGRLSARAESGVGATSNLLATGPAVTARSPRW